MTDKQKAVMMYLTTNGATTQEDLAKHFNTTIRGIGNVLSALIWMDEPTVRCIRDDGFSEEHVWTVAT